MHKVLFYKKAKKSERENIVLKGPERDSQLNPSNFRAFKTQVTPIFNEIWARLCTLGKHIWYEGSLDAGRDPRDQP